MPLDIRPACDSVDRNGIPEKCVSVIKMLHPRTSGRIEACSRFIPPFIISGGVRQNCPVSLFLLRFILENVSQNALSGLLDDRFKLLLGNTVFDLGYADGAYDAHSVQHTLDRLALELLRCVMCFARSECKVLL